MKEFSFCESTLASSRSPWHIRPLTPIGLRASGGVDTMSLCERVVPFSSGGFGGWDLHVRPPADLSPYLERGIICIACAEKYKKETLLTSAELEALMEKDPLIKAIVEDRIQDVAEGRTSRWTRLAKLGFEIKPKRKS